MSIFERHVAQMSLQSSAASDLKVRFAVDRGGTFTDVYASVSDGTRHVLKLLSVDPGNYADAPREGIRRILEQVTGEALARDRPVPTRHVESIRMGTTVATNALLERKGDRCALVITRGLGDLLQIGNQSRPRIFDLEIAVPDLLYERVVEVDERVEFCKGQQHHDQVKGITGEYVRIVQRPNLANVEASLRALQADGFDNIAVVFLHAYTFPDHEQQVGQLARALGFAHVTLSSEVMPMVKMVPRGYTACADAYLTPAIRRYIDGFCAGFDERLGREVPVLFMQSDGGLAPIDKFSGFKAILSGPAGGVVGYAQTTYGPHTGNAPVIGFDMGGTSTDVSRFAGTYEHVFETTTAGITIQAPQLDINTVAAGGGSCLTFRSGMFVVGPESASAHPGPVCYRKGGPLAVTDANLQLGRLLPEYFPHIFGASENMPLDGQATNGAFGRLQTRINEHCAANGQASMSLDEIAFGFINVANEAMCRPIRALTQAKGYDTKQHVLACFGGAGSQHACAIARKLGMGKIFVHRYSSVLSAYGIAMADVVRERQEPCAMVYADAVLPQLLERLDRLKKEAEADLAQYGFLPSTTVFTNFLNLRYEGTDFAIMTPQPTDPSKTFLDTFLGEYKREFGFVLPDRKIFVDDVRVRSVGNTMRQTKDKPVNPTASSRTHKAVKQTQCYFAGGRQATNVYLIERLVPQQPVPGPVLIIDNYTTIVVEPGCTAHLTDVGDVLIEVGTTTAASNVSTDMDPIQLAIFSHRFMSIAEQMGRTLQRTSISTNIKERLDFSCALFSPDGGLVANAPHIPVHLGSMQEAVRYQLRTVDRLDEGDVLVANHPQAGGSHLPDITVMTPVFDKGKVVFFVASRGHHADIGGIAPGSMPPLSKELYQEGACIKSFKLVKQGEFQHDGIVELLNAPGKYPGCSPTRNVRDVLADLKAQIAANHKGIQLVQELIGEYNLDVVQAYMLHIQRNAEVAVRDMLKSVAARVGHGGAQHTTLYAKEYMDDGTPIALKVTINKDDGTAVFDFEGTGMEVLGNCNAPPSVTYSAIIYCLRCMVKADVPLNQGCLAPITTKIPVGSILFPSETAAVVGGNVETSQRVTDVVLKAFGACAGSQGTMNNLTFGDETFGYYETIAGGAGAGPSWHGKSGVHTHMTNTRITDPEILERRYPVLLRRFSLRPDSGGKGQFNGGNGIVRELEFRKPLSVSILSERRVHQPYGLLGGQPGQSGMNILTVAASGRKVSLGGKNLVMVQPGDVLTILTPGAGGYGDPSAPAAPSASSLAERDFGSVAEYKRLQESV